MTATEYNECVELYADRVFRLVVKTMRKPHDAEDVVQNAFEVLWKNVATVPLDKAKSYLFTVAYRHSINYLRSNKRVTYVDELPQTYAFAPDDIANNALRAQLDAALQHLGEVQRAAVLLRDYEGYSYQEIGEMMTLTESQVKVYIYRARQKLQQLLTAQQAI